jgi:D-lactate dehydrogenase (cytochrome)
MTAHRIDSKHVENLRSLVPAERLSTGASQLDLHAKDQSQHPPHRPDAVIWPVDASEVSRVLRYANDHGIPVTGWGSGSSLEGNPIPVCSGIVLDFSQMNQVLALRAEDFQVDVQPGVIYQDLNQQLRREGLFFPPDPGARATIGGIIANNASGTKTVRYGSAKDYVRRLTVVLADGEIVETGTWASKSSSGIDLIHLFVGSEGTLGLVVEATLRLAALPVEISGAIATFADVETAAAAVFAIMRSGIDPAALELLDPACIAVINDERGLGLTVAPNVFVELHGASRSQVQESVEVLEEVCRDSGCNDFRPGLGRQQWSDLWKARHELGEMIVRKHPGCGILVADVAVPLTAYPQLIATVRQELERTGLTGYIISHAGNGNVHLNLVGGHGDTEAWNAIEAVSNQLVLKALEVGGTATGEHGVGIGKRKYMAAEHGHSLQWMKRIKHLFDPNQILNPGKIFPDE